MFTVVQRRPTVRMTFWNLSLREALILLEQGRHSGFVMCMYVSTNTAKV